MNNLTLKVTRLNVANASYVQIKTSSRELDVLLTPGKPADQSLRESAAEMRARAQRLLDRADLIDQAMEVL